MKIASILISLIFVGLLLSFSSCSGENSKTLEEECVDVEVADLNNSECLAESLLNVCNTFSCPLGPTPFQLTFMDCLLIDCSSLQCDDRIIDNIMLEEEIGVVGTTLVQPSNNEIEIMCIPLVQSS